MCVRVLCRDVPLGAPLLCYLELGSGRVAFANDCFRFAVLRVNRMKVGFKH